MRTGHLSDKVHSFSTTKQHLGTHWTHIETLTNEQTQLKTISNFDESLEL